MAQYTLALGPVLPNWWGDYQTAGVCIKTLQSDGGPLTGVLNAPASASQHPCVVQNTYVSSGGTLTLTDLSGSAVVHGNAINGCSYSLTAASVAVISYKV